MLAILFNNLAATVIMLWALWCIFCPAVNDGIIGKIIFSFTALAAFALMVAPGGCDPRASEALNWSFALLGLRQVAIRYVMPKLRHAAGGAILNRRATDL